MDDNNVLIICITAIICILIISGTFIFINFYNESNIFNIFDNGNNQGAIDLSGNDAININSVTFFSDGNPNTGETATIKVGKDFSGKTISVLTSYYRDGVAFNNKATYTPLTVDSDGNVVITDYTPMPKYPDYCYIEIISDGIVYKYECDIGKYKGTQTSIPREL